MIIDHARRGVVLARRALTGSLLATALALGLTCCSPAAPPKDGLESIGGSADLMEAMVAPSAQIIWDASSQFTATDGSVVNNGPKSDAEWLKLRHAALVLGEAMNLLAMTARPAGQQFKQQPGSGPDSNLPVAEVEHVINANRPEYVRLARSMQQAARQAIAASDRQDPKALAEVGDDINEICESCHQKFWYPREGGTG
jgi:hypothetical protein